MNENQTENAESNNVECEKPPEKHSIDMKFENDNINSSAKWNNNGRMTIRLNSDYSRISIIMVEKFE